MNKFKKIIIGVVFFFAFCYIIIFFLPNKFEVQTDIIINKSTSEVYDYLKDLKNQKEYDIWMRYDSLIEITYQEKGTPEETILFWNSKQEAIGKGKEKIIKLVPDSEIEIKIFFEKPSEAERISFFKMTKEETEQNTKLVYGFKGEMPYPSNVLLLFIDYEEKIIPSLKRNLQEIKKILELPKDTIL